MERVKTFFSRLSTAQIISLAVLLLLIAVVPVLVAFNTQQHITSQHAALFDVQPLSATPIPTSAGNPTFFPTPPPGCIFQSLCPPCVPGQVCPRIACPLKLVCNTSTPTNPAQITPVVTTPPGCIPRICTIACPLTNPFCCGFSCPNPTATTTPPPNNGCIRVCPTCVPGQICPQFACFLRCPTPTGTNGGSPTSGPTSTPTSGQGGTQLAFTIFLGGIGNAGDNSNPNATGNQNPLHTQRTLTVFVYDNNNQLVVQNTGMIMYNASPSGNFTGTVSIGNIPAGNYTIKVKTNQFLRKLIPGVFALNGQQSLTMPPVTLIAGDIAPVPQGDNALSLLDYNVLIGCFSDLQPAQSCTDAQKLSADLNDDGAVNQIDYNEFLRNLAVQNGD